MTKPYKVSYEDNSRLPAIVSVYNSITECLNALAIVLNTKVTLNRFYLDNEFAKFNFSVIKSGKEAKYLVTCSTDTGEWTIRSNKWVDAKNHPINTTSLSFGHFIRKTDHV